MQSRAFICPNCQHENAINAKFCENCSQKTKLKINSVWRMLFDFVANLIDYDSKLFSSIRGLFFPGFLTNEYLAKKRVKYLTPIRLFIFLMFALFFSMSIMNIKALNMFANKDNHSVVLFSLNNSPNQQKEDEFEDNFYTVLEKTYQSLRFETLLIRLEKELNKRKQKYAKAEEKLNSLDDKKYAKEISNIQAKIAVNDKAMATFADLKKQIDIKQESPFTIKLIKNTYKISMLDFSRLSAEQLIEKYKVNSWFDKLLFRQMYKFNHDASAFAKFVFQNLTWVIFLEVLLLSLFFKLFYIRSKRKYVEHFILQLHVHAWLFFIAIFLILLPFNFNNWFGRIILAGVSIYLLMSMKNVYQQSYFKTIIKFLMLSFIDLFIFVLALTLVLLVSAFVF